MSANPSASVRGREARTIPRQCVTGGCSGLSEGSGQRNTGKPSRVAISDRYSEPPAGMGLPVQGYHLARQCSRGET